MVVAAGVVEDVVELLVVEVLVAPCIVVVVLVEVELLEAGSSSELDPPPQPAARAQASTAKT